MKLSIIILTIIIMIISFSSYITAQSKTTVQDQIVQDNTPVVTQASNNNDVYINGAVRDNSPKNFKNVKLNIEGIGDTGKVVSEKMFVIKVIDSNTDANYNVTLPEVHVVEAGSVQVLNATPT